MTVAAGPDEKIYPVSKIVTIVDLLTAEGVSAADALMGVEIREDALCLPETRVSLKQIIECYRNAARLTRDPYFAYHAGLKFHLSAYGMWGFAILSSMNFRQTIDFAVQYHQLATPLADISFNEQDEGAEWTVTPIPHPLIDTSLYRFIVEQQFGIHVSLHQDIMGPSFLARELHVTYDPPHDAQSHLKCFGCAVTFGQPKNKLVFETAWLDAAPKLGNEITYGAMVKLCDSLMEELELRVGVAGKVREIILANLMRSMSFDAVARELHLTTRTLRRKLREEETSFRDLVDDLRMRVAIKYLRDTDLTTEGIAYSLGFSDAANFRHAFRRWTGRAPIEFRIS